MLLIGRQCNQIGNLNFLKKKIKRNLYSFTQCSVFDDKKYIYIRTDSILRIADIYAYTMSLINLCLLNELRFTHILPTRTISVTVPLADRFKIQNLQIYFYILLIFCLFAKIDFKRVLKKKWINKIEKKYDGTSLPTVDQGLLSRFLLQWKAKPKIFILINIPNMLPRTLLHYY